MGNTAEKKTQRNRIHDKEAGDAKASEKHERSGIRKGIGKKQPRWETQPRNGRPKDEADIKGTQWDGRQRRERHKGVEEPKDWETQENGRQRIGRHKRSGDTKISEP